MELDRQRTELESSTRMVREKGGRGNGWVRKPLNQAVTTHTWRRFCHSPSGVPDAANAFVLETGFAQLCPTDR